LRSNRASWRGLRWPQGGLQRGGERQTEGAGDTAQGIYCLGGDSLKICYALPGNPRPQVFATKPSDRELVFTMKRVPR
jgi:hypothetical protein